MSDEKRLNEKISKVEGHRRTLQYQPGIKTFYFLFIVLSALTGIGAVLFLSTFIITYTKSLNEFSQIGFQSKNNVILVGGIFLCAGVAAFLAFIVFYLKRFMSVQQVVVFDNRIEIFEESGIKSSVMFSEVKEVKTKESWILFPSLKLVTSEKEFEFVGLLQRSEYILSAIRDFNSGLVSTEVFEKFKKVAVKLDNNFYYLAQIFTNKKIMMFRFLLFPCIFVGTYFVVFFTDGAGPTVFGFIIALVFALLFQLLLLLFFTTISTNISSYVVQKNLEKNPEFRGRNFDFRNQIERISQIIQVGLSTLAVLYLIVFLLRL